MHSSYNIKVLLYIFSPETLECFLFSAPPPLTHWRMVQTTLRHCLSLMSPLWSSLFIRGVTKVVANIISHRRGHEEVCCGSSPWRGSTTFPPKTWWVLCLSCNPRQREDLNKQGRSTHHQPGFPWLRLLVALLPQLQCSFVTHFLQQNIDYKKKAYFLRTSSKFTRKTYLSSQTDIILFCAHHIHLGHRFSCSE